MSLQKLIASLQQEELFPIPRIALTEADLEKLLRDVSLETKD